MIRDSEKELENIFLSYNKILEKFKRQNVKTKTGKEITHKDLRYAISIMEKKHLKCRWKSQKINSKKYYILIEGFYWLKYVYFQHEKKLIDADIEFFIERIKQYEKLLNVDTKNLFVSDMTIDELTVFFNRKYRTVEKAIIVMLKNAHESFRYIENNKFKISKEGIEWLCKNCFKQKYLSLLENYKMELTEKYIAAGFPYDNFFEKN